MGDLQDHSHDSDDDVECSMNSAAIPCACDDDSANEFEEWLTNLDDGRGALLSYLPRLREEFDSLSQLGIVREQHPTEGSVISHIDSGFFDSIGVKQAGHRFLFARGICLLTKCPVCASRNSRDSSQSTQGRTSIPFGVKQERVQPSSE